MSHRKTISINIIVASENKPQFIGIVKFWFVRKLATTMSCRIIPHPRFGNGVIPNNLKKTKKNNDNKSRVFEINGFLGSEKKLVHLKNVHLNETTGYLRSVVNSDTLLRTIGLTNFRSLFLQIF